MTAFLIALGITSAIFLTLSSFLAGALFGIRRGLSQGLQLANDLAEDEDDAYFQHYGGLIDAGRRREN